MSESISGSTSESRLFNLDDEKTDWIRSACRQFRILIIGRANAGKTTILQKVCNTTELPVVYNTKGKEIDPVILEASASRGLHNIEDEMVFKSNPGFVFHDSRGFEAGGIEELNKVKSFIERRSKENWLPNKLHAIWYCIPVDDSRPFTTAENWFFSECGTGEVPVIVIFTKFDALDIKAFVALRKEGRSRIEARELASQRAASSFEEVHLETLAAFPYSPKGHVYLRNMNKEGHDCGDLVERTAAALDDETLRQLFVSSQRNNMEVCIRYALKSASRTIEQGTGKLIKIDLEDNLKEMIRSILRWFPHYFVSRVPNDIGRDCRSFVMRYYGRNPIGVFIATDCGQPPNVVIIPTDLRVVVYGL
ncbi:hypothetical protein FRC18_009906 [Serendipita sp. 400]|nr:hypothetical protein FRC18_009906 [Serendipita sp. 400]